jgi:hypothetical protein
MEVDFSSSPGVVEVGISSLILNQIHFRVSVNCIEKKFRII